MIKDIACKDLESKDFEDLMFVFSRAFDSTSPREHLLCYTNSVERVLVYYEKGEASAFLFYQILDFEGMQILHLSLSGKYEASRGVQKKLGTYLYFKYVFSFRHILRKSAFVTVSNNPRSYFNMYSIGPNVYPDVLQPSKKFKYHSLFNRLPDLLHLDGVEAGGLIPGRCSGLGFRIRSSEVDHARLDERGQRFMEFIGGDADNGVLVMVCVCPLFDVPRHFAIRIYKLFESMFRQTAH
ncbi:hypothetical protein [Marinobacter sp. F3R11]|uniref:hypothetical protein n=1 Tax=Marinobacter sp. F3R11 TaxID=2267231 RepID=UPI000DE89947|nr:hypothetical protein [Marinobacter sp. F3R11]RBW48912.1 hypothetical protein DS878_12300 [Marinobacter sp. F3R11]